MSTDWDSYFFNLLPRIAERSKDPHTQVGCIVVSPENNIVATGYNSFPRGIRDDVAERLVRPEKYLWIEHAERNAIYAAARIGTPLKGCRLYIPGLPCMDCGRAMIQTGISECVVDYARHIKWKTTKYEPDFQRVQTLLREGRVQLRWWYGNPFQPEEKN